MAKNASDSKAKVIKKIEKVLDKKVYGDLFGEVRQQVAAYKLYLAFWGDIDSYGKIAEGDYLDGAYRFLNGMASADFIYWCALHEGIDPLLYAQELANG